MIQPMRFGGMASGLDTENMIKQLMRAERMPMDRIFQRKQWSEWQRNAYRDVNSQLLEFRNIASDMRLQGTFLARKVTSTSDGVATAKASGAAANFTYDLQVIQLAKAGFQNSEEAIAIANPASKTELAVHDGRKFTINGREFTVNGNESLNDLINKINNARIGVSAFYDTRTQKVSLSSMVSGADKLNIDDTDGFLNDVLKFTDDSRFAGQDARFVLNGLETTRSSNTFTISGVEFSLKGEGSTRIASSTDTDKIFDTIKNFIDKYNELVVKTTERLTEQRYRSFPPLTDEQKRDMSDKEIELWEEKARSGLLRGDTMVAGFLSDMRTIMSEQVKGLSNGKISALFEIGIKSNNYLDRGFLHIDENKLRKALEEKPQEVIDLFTKQSENASERGLGARLYASVNGAIDLLSKKAGRHNMTVDNSVMTKEIKRFDEQLSRFESRLADIENRYWKQFTAMEKALSTMQSQGDYLMMQLMQQGR